MQEIMQRLIQFKILNPFIFWVILTITVILMLFVVFKYLQKQINDIKNINFNEDDSIINKKNVAKEDKALSEIKKNPGIIKGEKSNLKYFEVDEINKEKIVLSSNTLDNKIPPYDQMTEEQKLRFRALQRALRTFKEHRSEMSNQNLIYTNYSINVQNINSYPIFRFPKKDTVVRTHRLGKTKRRGYKEESFQKSIEKYFGKEFSVLGNVRINTGHETRPFEPDIAIINKTNLRIDIEIDEPYAGITRQPTHCKGDDVNRDLYFVDRGWVVIRFSEYQVHLQEKQCLKFIADIIKMVIPNYEIPNTFINETPLQHENLWDIVQAQEWEKTQYREKYLDHTFLITEEKTETIERDFNDQEIEEEQFVEPTFIGEVDNRKSIGYNDENVHLRDPRIKFYPEPHVYAINNVPAPSISTIIAKFFPEFDIKKWAKIKAIEKLQVENQDLSELNIQKMTGVIRKNWEDKGKEAANLGTLLHEQIENYYLKQHYIRTEEFHLFERFINEHNHLKPFRTEWRIFDEKHHIAGTIDLITYSEDGYEMYDWKRSKKVVSPFTGEPIKNNKWQRGVGQLSYIDDTSYNRYCLQQSLYKYILEKNYEVKVSKMFLIVLYPEYDTYYKVEVPYLKNEVEYILKAL